MATYQIIPANYINADLNGTKPSNLMVEIPTVVENNLLSFDTINFAYIDSIFTIAGDTFSFIQIDSFGFDTLPLQITNITNKVTKDYSLKI